MQRMIFWLTLAALSLLYAPESTGQTCGVERQPVKTLQDQSAKLIHFKPQESSVSALRVPKQPPNLRIINPHLRLDQEKQVYTVKALLVGFKQEGDQDFHLVLADPDHPEQTMIAEIPSPECSPAKYAGAFTAARAFIETFGKATPKFRKLKEPVLLTVTGVFFFDFIHGQTGVAGNGAELHPVLEISNSK